MDNISHSASGLVIGELIHRSLPAEPTPERSSIRRRLLLTAGLAASNLPDLDLVLTPLLPPPLGYLLHHRGHTHTVLFAIPQAMILFAFLWILWRAARELLRESSVARKGLFFSTAGGLSLHLLMDYLNSYGIHPFYPFDSRWFYGDMVFIIEPFFWVSFGVPLLISIERKWVTVPALVSLAALIAYFGTAGFLSWFSVAALFLTAAELIACHRFSRSRIASWALSLFLALSFVAIQSYSSGAARHTLKGLLAARDSGARLLDTPLTPFPTNPICWTFVSVESDAAHGAYRVQRGQLSLVPRLVPVSSCPHGLSEHGQAIETTQELSLLETTSVPLAEFARLKSENCFFDAWLRFARAPVVSEGVANDMRFSSSRRANFSTLSFDEFRNQKCPSYIPRWEYPRADLINQRTD